MVGLQRRRMTNKKVVTLKTILGPMLTSGGDDDDGGNSGNSTEDKWQLEKETNKIDSEQTIFKGSFT